MRWATRQHVLTSHARRRSVWHRWFAWYPVVVSGEEEFDHWVWFERLERKWSIGRYGAQFWRYRHPKAYPEQYCAEQYDEDAVIYFGEQMSRETGMPLQECIDRIEEDLSVGRVTIDFDEKNDRLRLVLAPTAFKKP
jgi:hypothetical protein